eukprot:5237263-Prorocentrum_lima.AAC.1
MPATGTTNSGTTPLFVLAKPEENQPITDEHDKLTDTWENGDKKDPSNKSDTDGDTMVGEITEHTIGHDNKM